MAKIKYLKQDRVSELKADLNASIERYGEPAPWLDAYFGASSWHSETKYEMPEGIELIPPDGKQHFDLENTKAFYSAMRDLPFALVSCNIILFVLLVSGDILMALNKGGRHVTEIPRYLKQRGTQRT